MLLYCREHAVAVWQGRELLTFRLNALVCTVNVSPKRQPQRWQPTTTVVDCVWNVIAHAQKPDFVFRRNGRVHLNWRGRQFSRLLAAEVCASAVVMLDTPCSEVGWRVLTTHTILQSTLHFPPPRVTVCHQISTGVYSKPRARFTCISLSKVTQQDQSARCTT